MEWKDFFGTIKKSELLGNIPVAQIVVQLFKAAGTMRLFDEPTAKKWISGERNCKAISYFPNGELNNVSETIKFFKNRPDNKLKQLQQLFREADDKDSPIDLTTEDMDIFCWSLVNQFLDLLGFQRLDTQNNAVLPSNNKFVNTIPALCNNHSEIMQNMIAESEYILYENEMLSQENSSTDTESQISIPKECEMCFYCINWKGNVHDARESEDGIYGKCLLYQTDILSSKKKICNNFKPSYERIPMLPQNMQFFKRL